MIDHTCTFYFVILVISHFGFEGWIWVLINPVPDHCVFITFTNFLYLTGKNRMSIFDVDFLFSFCIEPPYGNSTICTLCLTETQIRLSLKTPRKQTTKLRLQIFKKLSIQTVLC